MYAKCFGSGASIDTTQCRKLKLKVNFCQYNCEYSNDFLSSLERISNFKLPKDFKLHSLQAFAFFQFPFFFIYVDINATNIATHFIMLYGNLTHYYESNLLSQNTHIMSSELLICVIINMLFTFACVHFFIRHRCM